MRHTSRVAGPALLVFMMILMMFPTLLAAEQSASAGAASSGDVRDAVRPWLNRAAKAVTWTKQSFHTELYALISVAHAQMGDQREAQRWRGLADDAFGHVSKYDPWRAERAMFRAYAWAGKDDAALSLALRDCDDVETPDLLIELAEIQHERGDRWRAAQTYAWIEMRLDHQELEDNHDRNVSLSVLASSYARTGQWDCVRTTLQRRETKVGALQFAQACATARERIRQNKLDAQTIRDEIRALHKDVHYGCGELIRRAAAQFAIVHAAAGDVAACERWLQAVRYSPRRAAVLAHLAAAHQRAGRRDDACRAVDRALRAIDPARDGPPQDSSIEIDQALALATVADIVIREAPAHALHERVYRHADTHLKRAWVAAQIGQSIARRRGLPMRSQIKSKRSRQSGIALSDH